jgi:uncharacterized protein
MEPTGEGVQQRYSDALASFVAKVRQDAQVLAAILFGSLSYDEVWVKSDIDLWLIGKEEKREVKDYCLVEEGVNIHAVLFPRGEFKKQLEGSLQSSFFHSAFARSTLLFSSDETIEQYYQDARRLGTKDKEIQLLRAATFVLPPLAKAEKWFYVKRDLEYSFLWIMCLLNGLATIEVLMNDEVTGREVIQQALKFNPGFFSQVYTDLIHGPKDAAHIYNALQLVDGYLNERLPLLFRPILEFLAEEGEIRSTTELNEHFHKRAQTGSLAFAYEWLSDRGIIQKVSTPLRLTEKSRIAVEEAAYYYDGGSEG